MLIMRVLNPAAVYHDLQPSNGRFYNIYIHSLAPSTILPFPIEQFETITTRYPQYHLLLRNELVDLLHLITEVESERTGFRGDLSHSTNKIAQVPKHPSLELKHTTSPHHLSLSLVPSILTCK